jgi:general secretion pathway protein J
MRNKQRGLTLVELLVAISVLATVAVLGWRGLDGIVRARIALTHDLEQTREMQLTFAQLQSDCLHLALPSVLSNRAAIHTQPAQLNLVRTVFLEDQPPQLQVVSYQVNNRVLTRRESSATRDLKVLDAIWQAAINNTDTSPTVTLQSGVSAMNMRLWANGGSGWNSPIEAPSGTAAIALPPTGLEVALQLQGQQTSLLKVFLLGAL